jgi:hypothetical protein
MERPKRIANIIKGTKETIGMAPSRPIRRAVQAWLKAYVTTPKAARMEKMFITTALSGTNSERSLSARALSGACQHFSISGLWV